MRLRFKAVATFSINLHAQGFCQKYEKRLRVSDYKSEYENKKSVDLRLCKLTPCIKSYKSLTVVIPCQKQSDIQSDWTWIMFACLTQRGSQPDVLSLLSQLRFSVRNASTLHQSPLAILNATLPQWPTSRQLRRSSPAQTSPRLPLSFPSLLRFLLSTCNCCVLFPFSFAGIRGKPCGFICNEP